MPTHQLYYLWRCLCHFSCVGLTWHPPPFTNLSLSKPTLWMWLVLSYYCWPSTVHCLQFFSLFLSFFYPLSFLSLSFSVSVSVSLWPWQDGVWVRGLFLEGAGWDRKSSCLVEPSPMQLVCPMPTIHFKPAESKRRMPKGWGSSVFSDVGGMGVGVCMGVATMEWTWRPKNLEILLSSFSGWNDA